jgi:hypothetical protein
MRLRRILRGVDVEERIHRLGGPIGGGVAVGRAVQSSILRRSSSTGACRKSSRSATGHKPTSLDHLIKLTFFVKGPFPSGGVLSSPNFRQDVMDEFFAQHCPKHCSYNNPTFGANWGCCARASRPRS